MININTCFFPVLGIFYYAFSISTVSCILGNHKSRVSVPAKPEVQKAAPPIEVPPLSLDELKETTDSFGSKALIGEGSYGRVYYANLSSGKAVAVKKLDVSSEPETNTEFLTQACLKLNKDRPLLFSL